VRALTVAEYPVFTKFLSVTDHRRPADGQADLFLQ
jgi:hypothetical protein